MKTRTFALLLLAITILATAPWAATAQAPPLWATVPDPPPLPNPDRSGFVTNGGARLYYAVFHRGGGRPVILLHGGLSSSESWGFEVPRLIGTHEVIVMDSRGQGRSTGPIEPLTYDLMASDVVALMDALHVRRASIVGASDGGIIGLVLAIHYPERLDRLFAWGANFNTHSDSTQPPEPALKGVGAIYIEKMEAQYRKLSSTPDDFPAMRKALGKLYATQPNLTPAELGRITAPTVIADGEYEQFIAQEHTALLARLVPTATLLIIRNVSHGGPLQDPAAFHRAVATLLDGPRRRNPSGR
jgi:pimeloyl-ACP methyl ester carboxylesterase